MPPAVVRALVAAITACLALALPTAAFGQEDPPCGGESIVIEPAAFAAGAFGAEPCEGIAPTAKFSMSATTTTPGGTVQFDASTSEDTGGYITAYAWDLDGDGEFDDSTEVAPQFTYPVKQRVTVGLRVTDNEDLQDTETKDLAVTALPTAAITATPADPMTGDEVVLDAAGSSDSDGTIVNYGWDLDGDGTPDEDTEGTSHLEHAFPHAGTYDVGVEVTDDTGATATATTEVVVQNRAPSADLADPGLVLRNRVTTLSAAGSADLDLPDDEQLTFAWDLDGDGTYETSGDVNGTIDHTFTQAGPVTVGVEVTDDHGASDTDTRALTVTNAPIATLTATPNPVSLAQTVTLDASSSSDPDDAGATLTYEWDLDNDEQFDAPSAATRTTSWATAGTRKVNVRVTDESGAETVASVDVVVRNQFPSATIGASPAAPRVGESIQLTAGGSDPDGTIVRYQWDLDGDFSYETDTQATPSATVSFPNPGQVTVGVRVTDDDGGTGTKSLTITVAPPEDADDGTGGAGDGSQTPQTPDEPSTQSLGAAIDPGASDTPATPAGGPADGFTPTPERPFGAWIGGKPIQSAAIVAAKGLLVSCRAEPAVKCAVTASVSAADARRLKLGRRSTVVARSAISVPAGESSRARVKLGARARRAVRRAKTVRIVVRAVAQAADGREVALSRVFLVRA